MKLNVGEMHSDLEQAQREAVMHELRQGASTSWWRPTSWRVASTSTTSAWSSTSTYPTTAKTMCIVSDVLPVPTMTVWPSPSSAKRSRLTSTPSRNSLRGISIRFLFRPNWVKRPNTSRATTKKVDENEEEVNRVEADEKALATKGKKRIKNNLCFYLIP